MITIVFRSLEKIVLVWEIKLESFQKGISGRRSDWINVSTGLTFKTYGTV